MFPFRSSTTIPKSFFDAAELVNDLSDPTLDLDQVVFMTDSEDSTGAPDIALQEVVVNEHNKCLAEENPIQITVKQEEEFIIEDDGVGDVKSEDEEEQIEEIRGNFPFPSPYDSECIAHTILIPSELLTDDSEVNQGASTSFSADCEIIRIEPPSGMSPPPTLSQPSEDEQFELIHDEEKAEPDRSLVDHLYSQSETSKKDICNDIIQNMLIDTGHEGSSAAVKLLSKFNEILEHYFVEEENLQLSLFSRSMKKCLEEYKPAEAEQAIELPNPEKLLVFDEVPMTQEKVIEEDESSQLDLSLQNVDLPETELMEDDEATRIIDNLDAELPTFIKETESALKLKADLKNFQEIATKISTDASEMLKISMETEEKTSLAKEKFIELIKNTRQELQTVQTSVTGEEKQPKKKKKSRKIDLFDSDSDLDSYLNQMSKKSKSGPQTPAVVSSTKDDSEVGSDDEEAAPERSGDVSASSSSGEGKSVDKDIQRLLNFETLNNKPAPSKTLKTKIVKKTVKPKVPGDVSENYSSLSDNESDTEDSTTNVVSLKIYDLKLLLNDFSFISQNFPSKISSFYFLGRS